MKKVLIEIKNEYIIFSIYNKQISKIDLNNTNVIDTKKLLFTDKYILNNIELLSSFFNVIVNKNNVSRILINDMDIAPLAFDVMKNIKAIKQVYFKENKTLSYDICSKLQENKNIEYISCYNMPCYMFDTLDTINKVKINLRCEILFVSNFIENNDMHTYSDIYYKREININDDINNELLDDIKAFFKLNNNLRIINIYCYSKKIINTIIELIKEKNLNNICINIHQNKTNNKEIMESIKYLKEKNNLLKHDNNKIKIIYSNNFKQENFIKQININILRTSALVGCSFVLIVSGFYFMNISNSKNVLYNVSNSLTQLTNKYKDIKSQNNIYNSAGITDVYTQKLNQDFNTLLEINKETIGWLSVNNTKIDYPIVQHYNNDYYANHDFYNDENINGWVYMDYRNNNQLNDQNTIIYAHSNSDIMFGTLNNVLDEGWYTNESNQIITLNTPKRQLNYKIFSIYTILDTNDYLINKFSNDDSFDYFINMIKDRSIYDFNVDVSNSDKIITLSTCYKNSKKRLVVHAKLIK